AHELEDVLTPQVAGLDGAELAEVVLTAADSLQAMLAAYQKNAKLPTLDAFHKMIRRLLETPETASNPGPGAAKGPTQFAWTEYEQLMISEAVHRGEPVYNIALRIDATSLMRAAAFQLIRNVLHGSGTVIALRPEDNLAAATVEVVEAALDGGCSQIKSSFTAAEFQPSFPKCKSKGWLPHRCPSTNYWAICSRLRRPSLLPPARKESRPTKRQTQQLPARRLPPLPKAPSAWMPRASRRS